MRFHLFVLSVLIGCGVPAGAGETTTRDVSIGTHDAFDGSVEEKVVVTSPQEMNTSASGHLEISGNTQIKDRLGTLMYASGSGGDSDATSYCSADLVFESPGGKRFNFDGCVQRNMDASFEFDPDKRPEVRILTMEFSSTSITGYDCAFKVQINGMCGAGTYFVGRATKASLTTFDCTGVDDADEGEWMAAAGRVVIDRLEVDTVSGVSVESPVPVRVFGTMNFGNINDWKVMGSFQLNEVLTGSDAEEVECLDGMPSAVEAKSGEAKFGLCSIAVKSPRAIFFPLLMAMIGAAFRRRSSLNA
jgi:hypothetical protein